MTQPVLTVDIDVGGTLTDGIFMNDGGMVCVKVDTTPHDLTVCLFDCLTQGATQLGFAEVDAFLEGVDLIRWSTTITSNVLAERSGPRLGLIVSRGQESALYGDTQRGVLLDRLISGKHVIGVDAATPETEIMNAARGLLEAGVRRICVSLKDGDRHPDAEIRVKRIIEQQYPDHFLGSVPVLAGSDISRGADDRTRTYCALINAYTHGALAATLFKAEDELRGTHRYHGAFFVSHINGGVAGIAKTKAIDTIESGPILGIHGSSYLAKTFGLNNVIALDVGGTTAKVSVLQNGEPVFRKPTDFFGIPVNLSLPYLRSVALGGGSVVRPTSPGANPPVTLGPDSMGSFPGPACYGLGGDQPTLTDAFVSAGLINPDYFLGGTKPIDRELARQTVREHVADPLRLSVEEACGAIIDRGFQLVADVIAHAQTELQKDLSKHALFAYGGNGGLFACGAAEKVGLESVYFFNLGPVFSAFGSSVSDISHVYERALYLSSLEERDLGRIRSALEDMKAEGLKDLLGEGLRLTDVTYAIELEVSQKGQPGVSMAIPESALEDGNAATSHIAAALKTSVSSQRGAFCIDLARLQVKKSMPKPDLPKLALGIPDASRALKGTRGVTWGSKSGSAQIYRWESLQPGNRLKGCAVLEGAHSTYFVPEGWTFEMDTYGNGKLHRD
jgi:N-methylhydantoinase A/oxoprolinase/acetone carboxylase beta subunit